jgi:ABC-type antimicrobial peptide transport system permease subunit
VKKALGRSEMGRVVYNTKDAHDTKRYWRGIRADSTSIYLIHCHDVLYVVFLCVLSGLFAVYAHSGTVRVLWPR